MKIPFELFIGLRYLKAKRKQKFISLISVMSVAGVALGVMALIIVMSVMNGFQNDIRSKIIDTQAHVVVASYDRGGIPGWEALALTIAQDPLVAAVSPYLANQVMLKKDYQAQGVLLWGVDPVRESRVSRLERNLKAGTLKALDRPAAPGPNPLRDRGIILGAELANKLGAGLDSEITVLAPVFKVTAAGTLPKVATFRVVGIFEAGMYEFDANYAYVSLATAQLLFEQPGAANGMSVRVHDLDRAHEAAARIGRLGLNFWARDFMALNRNLATALKIEKIMMFIILILIVMVAAFNIASTLIMVVMEKKKDIGILKAIGATQTTIRNIFMLEGTLIGVFGTLFGSAAGLFTCWLLKRYPLQIPGGGSVYYIEKLPVATQNGDVLTIIGVALGVCLLSTLYPAWQASRLDPIEAIRYE